MFDWILITPIKVLLQGRYFKINLLKLKTDNIQIIRNSKCLKRKLKRKKKTVAGKKKNTLVFRNKQLGKYCLHKLLETIAS